MLLGIRLLGTTFWCGLSNHQATTAQMHLVGKSITECRLLLGALPLSPNSSGPWSFGRCEGGLVSDARRLETLALGFSLLGALPLSPITVPAGRLDARVALRRVRRVRGGRACGPICRRRVLGSRSQIL